MSTAQQVKIPIEVRKTAPLAEVKPSGLPSYMSGNLNPHRITAFHEKYYIDGNVYRSALRHSPSAETLKSMASTVEVKLDDANYPAATPRIIRYIHFAALQDELRPQPITDGLSLAGTPKLFIESLGVYSWCADMLHSSASFGLLRDWLRAQILSDTAIARAILCTDDAKVGGTAKRLELLKSSGLDIYVPEFASTLVCLHTSAPYINNLSRGTEVEKLKSGAIFDSTDYVERYYGPVYKYTSDVLSQFYIQQAKLACYEHPFYKRVKDFGPDCAAIVRGLCEPAEIDILITPRVDIADIYHYGLGTAVVAARNAEAKAADLSSSLSDDDSV